jgi:pyruvate kinase
MSLHDRKQKKAKMVCTLGPSSAGEEIISALIKSGTDVARLNFSHGDHQTHNACQKMTVS